MQEVEDQRGLVFLPVELAKVKFVTTFHGTYNFKSPIKKYYNSIMLKADHIIAGSKFIYDHIHLYYKTNNPITIVKRGIDQNYFNPSNISNSEKEKIRKEMGFSNDNFLVLLPGRLTAWKGQKLFIEAANFLKKQDKISNIFFIILGDAQGRNEYESELKSLIFSYKLMDKVRIVKPKLQMPLAYAFTNLIVSASVEPEAFGRVSVEAQAMQKLILASEHGGSIETVINNKTGWFFKTNNVEELANNIYRISKIPKHEMEQIGIQGRENVKQNFTKDQMCLKTLEIYHSLV